jgi:hypothetical protein
MKVVDIPRDNINIAFLNILDPYGNRALKEMVGPNVQTQISMKFCTPRVTKEVYKFNNE